MITYPSYRRRNVTPYPDYGAGIQRDGNAPNFEHLPMTRNLSFNQSTKYPFDLGKVLYAAQDFRWCKLDDDWHSGVLAGNLIHIRQVDNLLEYKSHSGADLDEMLRTYFRLMMNRSTMSTTTSPAATQGSPSWYCNIHGCGSYGNRIPGNAWLLTSARPGQASLRSETTWKR